VILYFTVFVMPYSVTNLGLLRPRKIILTTMIVAHCVQYTLSKTSIPITPR
jgi:hypothetical protein